MKNIYTEYAINYNYGFQDPATPFSYAIIDLHDRILFYLIIIFTIVLWFLISSIIYSNKKEIIMSNIQHGLIIEMIWTLIPAIILWIIALPSLKLLYLMDELLDSQLTIKISGNQWYWSYEYSDFKENINFDSFMIQDDDLTLGDLRLLTVDNPLILPINTNIRLLVTSNDVIHSWAIPSLTVKLDAMAGRLNSTGILISRPSTFYGMCSELCGSSHAYMPIMLKAVSINEFINYINSHINN